MNKETTGMPLQVNIFILLFGALQGLLLTLFLVKRRMYEGGYIFLLLYFGAILLQIAMKVMNKLWLMQNWFILYEVSYFLPLLYGPLIFLFTQQVLLRKRFTALQLLHFLPFLFLLAYLVVAVKYSTGVNEIGFFYRIDVQLLLNLGSLFVYHVMAFQNWTRYRSTLKMYFSDTQRLQVNWIRQFIITSAIVCTIVAIALYLIYINNPQSRPFRYFFAVLSVFIYWISYVALSKPSVFSVVRDYAGEGNNSLPFLPALVVHRPVKKYNNSGLSKEVQQEILALLHKEMTTQKLFLRPELTIHELADSVKCNRHHLSQALNETLSQSFYDYINHYRVEEAKQLLTDASREEHKISSIAYDAGFNSLSTFNDVFKKLTGTTPSRYKKQPGMESKQERG